MHFMHVQDVLDLIRQHGDLGLFLGMFLESSIFPVPSELIIVAAGSLGIPLMSMLIFGSLGSTCGAAVGYLIGRYGAKPVILKFGKYIFIQPHHLEKAEAFTQKHGVGSVLIGRLLPIIPFKVFSIAAGITRIPWIPFIICTFVGVIPRIFLLSIFGMALVKYTKYAALAAVVAGLLFWIYKKYLQPRVEKPPVPNK